MSDLVERFHPVDCLQPAADAGGRTGAYINVKNTKMIWAAFHINQGNAATVACDVLQATSLAGAGAVALSVNAPIWANLDTAASDALVRAADAKTYTTDAGVKRKIVIFQIDPAALNLAGGFAYIACRTGASNAANITEAEFFCDMTYEGALPPSVVV
jgi:hypothetical protein